MADPQESNLEGAGVVDPGQGQPASAQTDVQPTSVDADVIAAYFGTDEGKEVLSRAAQSQKDRRFVQQEKQLSSFQEELARMETLQQGGMSRDQAMNQMSLEDRLKALEGQGALSVTEETAPAQGATPPNVDVDAVLKAVGVEPNDPRVTEFLKQGQPTAENLLGFVTQIKGTQQQPNPAQSAPTPSGTTPQPDLKTAYDKEIQNEGLTREQKLQVRRKYRKLGLDT